MKLRILGCHGGSSVSHRNVSFVLNDRVAVDAGSLAAGLSLDEQLSIEAILITHSHMDHVADLGVISDLRQQQDGPPVSILGLAETVEALSAHFFNDVLWPDFRKINLSDGRPTVELHVVEPEQPVELCGLSVRPVPVDHSVPSCGFIIDDGSSSIAYSGDTGPTKRFWDVLGDVGNLKAVITEVSYPNRLDELAHVSGHLTPALFRKEIAKLGADVPVHVYGMKPAHVDEITSEMSEVNEREVNLLAVGDTLEL